MVIQSTPLLILCEEMGQLGKGERNPRMEISAGEEVPVTDLLISTSTKGQRHICGATSVVRAPGLPHGIRPRHHTSPSAKRGSHQRLAQTLHSRRSETPDLRGRRCGMSASLMSASEVRARRVKVQDQAHGGAGCHVGLSPSLPISVAVWRRPSPKPLPPVVNGGSPAKI